MTNNKTKSRKRTKTGTEKSLGQVLDILYRARVEAALDKMAAIREQTVLLFARAEQGHLSSSAAKTFSLRLQQELSRTVSNLGTWRAQVQNRI